MDKDKRTWIAQSKFTTIAEKIKIEVYLSKVRTLYFLHKILYYMHYLHVLGLFSMIWILESILIIIWIV